MTTTLGQVLAPQFASDLVTSITARASGGSEVATFTRATTAYQIDFEGKHNAVLSGEARFQGARRVLNSFNENGFDNRTGSVATYEASTGVTTLVYDGSGSAGGLRSTVQSQQSMVIGENGCVSWDMMMVSPIALEFSNNQTGKVGITPTTAWIRYALDLVTFVTASFQITIYGAAGNNSAFTLLLRRPQGEVLNGINTNPSEYVSRNVLSAPYHGAGVDGVKYFTTLNGNTVASNVVTEATGAAIVTGASGVAATAPVDAGGPFGYLTEDARADVLGTTAAIRRIMTDAGWVNTTMTVGAATGTDGVASAAASLTATGANSTSLFTTVLGAAIRTYSAWVRRKTGTGTVNITGDNGATWTAITLTTTYALFQFTTASAANPVVGFRLVTSGDAIEVDWNTLEAATFANPTPIPLNVSKAADVLTYPTSGNFSDTAGTMYAETAQTSWANAAGSIIGSATQGMMPLSTNSGVKGYDGTNTVNGTAGAPSGLVKMAVSWTGTTMNVDASATAVVSGTYDTTWNLTTVGVGTGGFGTVRNVRIYSTALSAGQLTAMTST